jgi:hypothetical protein
MSHSQQTVLDRFYNEFQDLSVEQQQEFFKLVKEMYIGDKNLNLKTDIKNPAIHSTLDLMAMYFNDIGVKDGSKYIKFYSRSLKEQMVSDNRKGRIEFKELMSAKLQNLFRSFGDRMLGRHNEE